MHLILEYPERIEFSVQGNDSDSDDKLHDVLIKIDNKNNFGLQCIISINFSENLINSEILRNKVYNKMHDNLERRYGKNIDEILKWAAFASLGAEDFVIIVLANDIKTFGEFIQILKEMRYSNSDDEESGDNYVFLNINSFTGFNNADFSGDPKSDLILRLNLKSGKSVNEFRDELKKEIDNIKITSVVYHS